MALNAYEQLFLELVNRARLDPQAEATRQGVDLNAGLAAGTINTSAKQALAPNALLNNAATGHSQWMLEANRFSHTGEGGSSSQDRIKDAGYNLTGLWRTGENLALDGNTAAIDPAATILALHEQLFASADHRPNLMDGRFRETGVGNELGIFTQDGVDFNASVITQLFATSGSQAFITGVIYDDLDGDLFYDIGEGRGGATISAGGNTATASDAGGYALGVDPGKAVAVSFRWNGILRSLTADATDGNVKLDLLASGLLMTSGSVVLGNGFTDAMVLGVKGLALTGNGSGNRLTGNIGNDTLDGGGGRSTLVGGLGDDTYILRSAQDVLVETANGGTDTVRSHIDWTLADHFENLELLGSATTGTGNAANNILTGNALNNTLSGGGGNDTLHGEDGDDLLVGGAGNDRLYGGDGNDTLRGHADKDRLYGGDGDDKLYGGVGKDRLYGDAGNDTLYGEKGFDRLFGGNGADLLYGHAGNDTLNGGNGDDVLYGGKGDDVLFGGARDDKLFGGAGNDTLEGGAGSDTLKGGDGADVFVFGLGAERDRITDFSLAEGDRLQIDRALWDGDLNVRQVLNLYSEVKGGNLLLTFGTDVLRIDGLTDPHALIGNIDLF
ncbi:Hemolysin-type calcium-binding repeat-containing protein [Gemmobacter megaterium]|uniref:Hemolysin-type calcium-binding repeat-containing protein n=1 Tax=Gemmobacter megaterium TaxID=1086013 RepID=A0A1N7PEE8_9RHOB|nr:CAP domain-containing protein [Gemmobacter megaterium]GGE18787.1 hypothetical protein GCM10011345_25810 [Gemmobacter megaterium]SIT08900.1 Hemolysin-type calcium-binding repeat-containing protein [Gemmobacter megaterium]